MSELTRLAVVKKKPAFSYNLQPLDAGVKFLAVILALVIKENVAEKNVIYFLLRFSPIARCVNRFWRYNVFTSA